MTFIVILKTSRDLDGAKTLIFPITILNEMSQLIDGLIINTFSDRVECFILSGAVDRSSRIAMVVAILGKPDSALRTFIALKGLSLIVFSGARI